MMNPDDTEVSSQLVNEIVRAIRTVDAYGSIEIYVQNNVVTQITVRNIKKTSVALRDDRTLKVSEQNLIKKSIRVTA